jgi:hypothetical protein
MNIRSYNNNVYSYSIHTCAFSLINLSTKNNTIQKGPAQSIVQIAIDYGNFLCSDCSFSYEKEHLFNRYAIAFLNKFLNKTVLATNRFAAKFLRFKKFY